MYSQGGKFLRRWCDNCGTDIERGLFCSHCLKTVLVRFTARPSEISYVDKGSNPNATFQFVRSDGGTEVRKFASGPATLFGWQCDSTGFEADGQDSYVLIEPVQEPDATGFEIEAEDWIRYFERDVGDDETGFEDLGKAECPEARIVHTASMSRTAMTEVDPADDSTGFV